MLASIVIISLAFLLGLTSALSSFNGTLTIPFAYPLMKQCDERWGEDLMGTKTVCQVGCLMSSTAMGLAGAGIPIRVRPEIPSNPKTLNAWLRENDGYSGNNLIEGQVVLIDPERISWTDEGMHRTNDLSFDEVRAFLDQGRVVIANVNAGGHFVLLTGYSLEDFDTFAVNDPGYNRDTYSYKNDVVGYRIFDMVRQEEAKK